jgi:HD-GYP domain-containing protein (c-di-GMP phosphodiesterase class II)
VLTKPTALTEDEWRLVRQHPKRYYGNDSPSGLVGNGIRVEARVLAICDSWAPCSSTAYQPVLSVEAAAEQLRQGRGTQLYPDVVDLLRKSQVGDLKKPTELSPEQQS